MIFGKNFFNTDLLKIFIYGGNIVINRFLGFLIILLITQRLDQSLVGQYFIFLNIQSILVSISILGLPSLIIKELSLNFKKKINDTLIEKTIIFSFFLSMSLLFLLTIFFYIYYNDINFIFFIFLSSAFTIINAIFFYLYLSFEKILIANFLEQILKYLLILSLLLILFFFHFSILVQDIIKIYIISNLLITFCFFLKFLKIYNLFNKNKKNIIFPYFNYTKYTFIVGLSGIFTILNSKIDILMIEFFLNEVEVSIYGIGNQLAFLMYLPTIGFSHVLMSKLSIYIKRKIFFRLNIIIDVYRFILVSINLFIFITSYLLVDYLIQFFFGMDYILSKKIFLILITGYFIGSFFSFNDVYMNYIGNEKKITFIVFICSLINITFNYLLIPKIGINGAAISLAMSHVIFNFLAFSLNYKNNLFFLTTLKILINKKKLLIRILTN
jgi:O-antigen/teichoic acid export membrane protein